MSFRCVLVLWNNLSICLISYHFQGRYPQLLASSLYNNRQIQHKTTTTHTQTLTDLKAEPLNRSSSSTAFSIMLGRCSNFCSCEGCCSRIKIPLAIKLVVVSWPATRIPPKKECLYVWACTCQCMLLCMFIPTKLDNISSSPISVFWQSTWANIVGSFSKGFSRHFCRKSRKYA